MKIALSACAWIAEEPFEKIGIFVYNEQNDYLSNNKIQLSGRMTIECSL
jgi:hypothetical protein